MSAEGANGLGRDDFAQLVRAVREALQVAGAVSGLTTAEVARRYRVGEDRVRAWIKAGALKAVNTSDIGCAKPRFVVTVEALAEFERTRSTAPLPKPVRRRRADGQRDFFPD